MDAKQEEMVVRNRQLVYYLVRKMGIPEPDYEDVVSIGIIGLIKAASNFDETKGIKFATYASRCINNEIFMYFRKEKKHEKEVSLESLINTDKDGNELTLADVIQDSGEDFTQQIEEESTFIDVINFIINALKTSEKIVTLYNIAGLTQKEIEERLNISQSYVSRLITKACKKAKAYLRDEEQSATRQFKEVFHMSMEGNLYKISFSSTDVKNFNKIFSSLMMKWDPKKDLPNFKVSCTPERIIIILPAVVESFALLADVIREIDTYIIETSGKSNLGNNPKVAESDFTSSEEKTEEVTEETLDSDSVPEVTETETASDEEKTEKVTEETIDSDSIPEVTESHATSNKEETDGISEEATDSDNIPEIVAERKGSKMEMIRNYILSVNNFTINELKEKFTFPNASSAIPNAVTDCKKRGLIICEGRGKYSVIKKENL